MILFIDLLLILIIAFIFVLIFKIQKFIYPGIYYSVSFYIIENNITVKQVIVRYFIVFSYSSILSYFITKSEIVILGIAMGAFLIIWPAIINPKQTAPGLINLKLKKKILYFSYLTFFIIASIVISLFGVNLNFITIVQNIVQNLITTIIILVVIGNENKLVSFLSRSLVRNSENSDVDE